MKIEIIDLVHTYPTGDVALRGITTTLEGTEPVAIVGQNGSGKTTLVKHLNGILRPTKGDVLINGVSINTRSTAKWAKQIGYVFQNPDDQLFLETVRKELEFGPKQVGMAPDEIEKNLKYAAELCNIEHHLDKHPFDLSITEKKFCTIASIIAMDPEVIIFDEPTMGQDTEGTDRLDAIIQNLKAKGKLCITISHDMKFVARNFSRVMVLYQGQILLDGNKAEVLAQPEKLKLSFVTPPPVTRVAQCANLPTVFTVEDLIRVLKAKKGA